ncbi:putative phosphatidate phosphatase isoform X2 [Apis dorsata]|uniref:putative phosphatidate phosphatase isoform X2 n=1 Tax=Apis dorsata TaxID=7462 RepID=UPI0012930ED8|nr:putative phosphatidate phosphatase isoform X2 [Apis dorsata]
MTVLMFYLFGKPYKRGFFCNDESLYHPFHDSTVTSAMLYVIGLLLPICTIGIFGFGAATTVLLTDIAKYTIGRLRPHFMTLCEPNINCSLIENQHRYIENYSCNQNISKSLLKEIRLSFPSGHSSFSAYTMIYLAMYLQLRITWKGSKLLKHFLQLVCLLMAWFTALSRVSDYKHHWSDVLAGSTLGTITALVVVNFVADLFKDQNHYSVEEKHRTTDYETGTGTQAKFFAITSNKDVNKRFTICSTITFKKNNYNVHFMIKLRNKNNELTTLQRDVIFYNAIERNEENDI